MYKFTDTYTDYNGVERKEDFYFNLTKAELADLQNSKVGGFAEMLQKIFDSKDTVTYLKVFKDLIRRSYGVKSDDGRRFIKNDEVWNDFAQTEAYSDLYMMLCSDDEKAADFVNKIIPQDIQQQVAAQQASNALHE